MTPGAIARRSAGSGPTPSGNRLATITKNSSTVSASELRRTASSRSRWITQRSAAIMSARLEIDAQRRGGRYSRLEVRREDHRGAPRNVLGDQALHAVDRGGVERGKRLIQDPQRHRLAQGEPRKSHAPPLPLRKHPRGQIFAAGKAETGERLADPRGLRPHAGERARRVQVLGGGQVILDRIGVSHVDEPPPEFLLQPPDIFARPAHFAASRLEQPARDPQEAGLPGAVGPADAQQLAAAQREPKTIEQRALAARALEIDALERGGFQEDFHAAHEGSICTARVPASGRTRNELKAVFYSGRADSRPRQRRQVSRRIFPRRSPRAPQAIRSRRPVRSEARRRKP